MDQNIQDILCNVKEYLKKLSDSERFFALKDHTHIKAHVTDFVHNNDHHSEEYVTQTNIDTAKSELQTEINKKSTVVFSRTLGNAAGKTTKIGQIKIDDNNPVEIYCEKNTDTIYEHPATHSTNMIKDPNAHNNIGSAAEATQSTINSKIDTELSKKSPTVTFTPTLTSNTSTKKIGEIKIGSTKTDLYCDKNTVYTHPDSLSNAISSGMYKISANKQGHIIGATGITQNDITSLGIPTNNTATESNAGLMSAYDKQKMNKVSQYRMFITKNIGNLQPPASTVIQINQHDYIYATVINLDGTTVENKYVDFILGGQGYPKLLDPENMGYAKQQINWNPGWYTITCIYRVDGWTVATDTRALQVI